MKILTRSVLALPVLALLLACTHQHSVPQPLTIVGQAAALDNEKEMRWHSACFYMDFKENGDINWVTDLMLADLVISPVLREKQGQLPLWRFHRRAGRDSAGHRFSFIYYTDQFSHQAITELISQSATLRTLLETKQVKRLNNHCRADSKSEHNIEATSDPNWDPRLQKTWPYYIMGVSVSWLALIKEIKASMPDHQNVRELYQNIDKELIALWQGQGQHVYLHHLSAVFGYRPLVIQNWIQF